MKDAIDIGPDDPRLPELQKIVRESGSWGADCVARNFLAWHDNLLEAWEREGIIKWQK